MTGYASDLIVLEITGTHSTNQTWSTSLKCAVALSAGSWGVNSLQQVNNDWETMVETWWGSTKAYAATYTFLTGSKLYYYPPNQRLASLATQKLAAAPIAGTNPVPQPPYQAQVVSLRTNRPGRSFRGRSFFPATGGTPNTNGQFSSPQCSGLAAAYKTLINALNAYSSVPGLITSTAVVIASQVGPTNTAVSSLVVDSKPDVQHRREDKIAPVVTATATIP